MRCSIAAKICCPLLIQQAFYRRYQDILRRIATNYCKEGSEECSEVEGPVQRSPGAEGRYLYDRMPDAMAWIALHHRMFVTHISVDALL